MTLTQYPEALDNLVGSDLRDAPSLASVLNAIQATIGTAGAFNFPTLFPGVVADGVTDNTETISNWIAANMPFGGDTPRLPIGKVCVNGLSIPAGVTLVGCGSYDQIDAHYYGTILIPAVAGQSYTLSLDGNTSGFRDLTVDGLVSTDENHAAHALRVNAIGCKALDVGIIGGTTSSLYGTNQALQFTISQFWVRTGDGVLGTVYPIQTTAGGNDWMASNGVVNGPGGCYLDAPICFWDNIHFVQSDTLIGTAALITDHGRNFFTSCYLDSTCGTAIIDRSDATNGASSGFANCGFLQNTPGVTGIPVIKEGPYNQGVLISNCTLMGNPISGSSFTHFMDTPQPTTRVNGLLVPSAWLTSTLVGTAAPCPGSWTGVFDSEGNNLNPTTYFAELTADISVPANTLTTLFVTPSLVNGSYMVRVSAFIYCPSASTAGFAEMLVTGAPTDMVLNGQRGAASSWAANADVQYQCVQLTCEFEAIVNVANPGPITISIDASVPATVSHTSPLTQPGVCALSIVPVL